MDEGLPAIEMLSYSLLYIVTGRPYKIVRGVQQIDHHPIGVLGLFRIEHPGPDADPHLLT